MWVYLLIQEHQFAHGYVDTSILGVYATRDRAQAAEDRHRKAAQALGFHIEDPEGEFEDDWEISWSIEAFQVD